MSKRILLIDSDEGFAQGLSSAIKARGFAATLATNSEQGMSLAKQESPDLIVVCVEAQPTNGYMLCTRLKKDDQLKAIPIILTSANATPDSFEKHKKLKTRAEEYLIKPFAPQIMLEKASQLLGVQLPPEPEEEAVAAEDEPLGLGDLVDGEDEPISLSAADVAQARSALTEEPLVVEEVEEVVELAEEGGGDRDLEMFDKAFDSLGGAGAQPAPSPTSRFADGNGPEAAAPARPAVAIEVAAPADDAVLHSLVQGEEPVAVNDPESQLDARIAELEQRLAEREAQLDHARKGAASTTEVIRIKEAKNKAEKEILRLKEELNSKDRELVDLQEQQTALESQAQQLKDDAVKREAAAKSLQQRADSLAAAAKKFERELTAAREEVKKGGSAAEVKAKIAQLEKELEGAKTEVAALTGEKDLLSEERDDLKKQVEEALASAEKNEDRAVKAYARIKNEEKLREKARKALEIALQLLEKSAEEDEDDESAKKFA
ncbi:MAG TPA: response regulator [Myxococcales bacterium]|nr:response regulator [Myxococcales bacterium]